MVIHNPNSTPVPVPSYLLGLDVSTTGSKAVLIDHTGRVVESATGGRLDRLEAYRATGARLFVPYFLGLLGTTHGAAGEGPEGERLLSLQVRMKHSHPDGARPEEIAGIGNTGHGNGLYLLDKQGCPLRNGIQCNPHVRCQPDLGFHKIDLFAVQIADPRIFPGKHRIQPRDVIVYPHPVERIKFFGR